MTAPVLELRGVSAGYGQTTVVRAIELEVGPGEVVALFGPNGAGKTTLLRVAAGLLRPQHGTVWINGADATAQPPHARSRLGICMIPEGRGIFPALSVRENLRLQVPPRADGTSVERALEAFPILAERMNQRAGSMSGGEQQMLALSRCWLASPSCVLLDEVSMGLAPRVVEEIYAVLGQLAARGVALVIVEQHIDLALGLADRVHLLDRGRTEFNGSAKAIDRDALVRSYLADVDPERTAPSSLPLESDAASARDTTNQP
jgi:branched-chain amino acid transport system ATP-binding protein